MLENKLAFRITCVAALLSFIVILLGVTTRLKDAGLGCPDWPGCYGKLIVPHQSSAAFAEKTLNPKKAWLEMIHRYAAAALALLSFAAITLTLHKRKLPQQPVKIAFLILILLFFQALLGKWTVTLRLHPLIVMLHLLGGLSLLSLLCLLLKGLIPFFSDSPNDNEKKLRLWSRIGLLLIIIQIMLGGWTSSNYAAFVCPDFPRCQGEWWPSMNFIEGFHLWTDSNRNFEGGLLSNNARTAIQMCHRIGALITATYLTFLSWKLRTASRKKILHLLSTLIMLFLILQVSLGIMNVIYLLPLPIAIAHNGFAALLLLLLITLNSYTART
ncbi:MAG: COX15/CtaA family protein [Pseudomonadota bacterium]